MTESPNEPVAVASDKSVQTLFHSRPYLLSFLLTALLTVPIFLTPVVDKPLTKSILSGVGQNVRSIQTSFAQVSDPKIGAPLDILLPSGFSTKQIPKNRPLFVVFIGSCAGCVQGSIQNWEAAMKAHPAHCLVFVGRDAEESITQFRRKTQVTAPILADVDGKFQRALNAAYVPRAYHFDVEGKLSWRQTNEDGTPDQLATECLKTKEKQK